MRIRQVRPEFFSDGRVSRLPVEVRLTYIGLWCVADDDGWLPWNDADLGAQLYPYESVRVREHRLERTREALVGVGRLVLHDCGCAVIPTLPDHQKIGGTKAKTHHDRHDKDHRPDKSIGSRTRTPVGRYVGSEVGNAGETTNEDDRTTLIAAFRRQGLPVDVA